MKTVRPTPDVEQRIRAIRRSLQVFAWGAASLVPVLGIIAGPVAVLRYFTTRRRFAGVWNPGVQYLNLGAWLGGVGMLLSLVLVGVIVLQILQSVYGW
jgi:hypothetical protein